ncbi:MAG: ribose-phosphate diphosphokinase [Anaerolineae bacterium]|jgi:ribose-phosphate pyrophosphokinase|nr:ribose-phosphate diphosphokinase [Anaerolineae bacterium]
MAREMKKLKRHQYGKIKLFAGSASKELADKIACHLGLELEDHELIEFPNENLFPKLRSSVRGHDTYIIQTTSSPVHRNLMELELMLQTLRLDSAARVTAVFPYMCYARSDKKDQPRVSIAARLVADHISAEADRYMTFDLHAGQIQGFFSIPGDVLTTFDILVDHLKVLLPEMHEPIVVTADLGFAKKARNFADHLDTPLALIEKRRKGNDARAKAMGVIGEIKGHDVILVDDEIDTGGSIVQAVDMVRQYGAQEIYIVFVHPVLSLDAAERLAALPVKQFICTDTIPIPEEKKKFFGDRLTVLTIADLLAEVILRANQCKSVGALFDE